MTGLQHGPAEPLFSSSSIEPKVTSATAGAGLGGAVTNFVLWALDGAFWNGDAAPEVPGPVAGLVWVLVPAVVAFAAGWLAPHVDRWRGNSTT